MKIISLILPGLLLCCLVFLLRVKPRLRHRYFGTDTWWYLLYADVFRRNRQFPVKLPYFLLDIEEQWYPPVFPLILSLLSDETLKKWQWTIGALVDSFHLLMLYGFTLLLGYDLVIAVAAGLIFAITPILVDEASNLNVRGFASAFLTLSLLATLAVTNGSQPLYLYASVAVLSGTVVLLAHKMTTQELVAVLATFLVLERDTLLLWILLGMFITAVALSKGFYIKVLKGHFDILRFYRTNHHDLRAHLFYDSGLYSAKDHQSKKLYQTGVAGFLKRAQWIVGSNPFIGFPASAVLLNFWPETPAEQFCFWWLVTTCAVAILTFYVEPLKFLGEGHKYIRYTAFPAAFLSAVVLQRAHPRILFAVLALAFVGLTVFAIRLIYRMHSSPSGAQVDDNLLEVFGFIRTSTKDRIACFPLVSADALAYFGRKKVLWGGHSGGFRKLEGFFPVIQRPIEEFLREYGINLVLIDQRFVNPDDLDLTRIGGRLVLQRGDLLLYEMVC